MVVIHSAIGYTIGSNVCFQISFYEMCSIGKIGSELNDLRGAVEMGLSRFRIALLSLSRQFTR